MNREILHGEIVKALKLWVPEVRAVTNEDGDTEYRLSSYWTKLTMLA